MEKSRSIVNASSPRRRRNKSLDDLTFDHWTWSRRGGGKEMGAMHNIVKSTEIERNIHRPVAFEVRLTMTNGTVLKIFLLHPPLSLSSCFAIACFAIYAFPTVVTGCEFRAESQLPPTELHTSTISNTLGIHTFVELVAFNIESRWRIGEWI